MHDQEIRRPKGQANRRTGEQENSSIQLLTCSLHYPFSTSSIQRFLTLAICLLYAFSPVQSIHAQTQPQAITITARAGYGGVYRVNEWFPLTIDLRNDGADLQGELEWSLPSSNDGTVMRSPIDLPRGSQKRVQVALLSRTFSRNAYIRIIVNGQHVAQQNVPIEPIEVDKYLMVVISSDPTLLNVVTNLQLPPAPSTTVQHMRLDELPEQAAVFRSVNTLVLHDIDTAQLSAQQRNTLRSWVGLGGQLIVSGGVQGQLSAAGVADMLPATLRGSLHDASIEKLLALGNSALPSGAQRASLSDLEAQPGARDVIGDGLIWERQLGAGTTLVTAFDLGLLRGWPDETRLWEKLLHAHAQFIPTLEISNPSYDLIRSALQLPGLNLPPTGYLVVFLFLYILLIGPLNYLVLRQMKRLEWAWISIPILVALMVTGLYIFGLSIRGGQPNLSQVSIVQMSEGEQKAQLSAFIGLFSPFRTTYTIGLPPQSLVLDQEHWNGNNPSDAVRIGASAVEIPNALVDVSSVRSFSAESNIDMQAIVQSSLASGQQTESSIQNRSTQVLKDVLVIRGETFTSLGSLQPGESRSFILDTPTSIFPWGAQLDESGRFNRRSILTTLFNGDHSRFSDGKAFSSDESYVLAWTDTPLIPVQLNGAEQTQQGYSLYVVRLK